MTSHMMDSLLVTKETAKRFAEVADSLHSIFRPGMERFHLDTVIAGYEWAVREQHVKEHDVVELLHPWKTSDGRIGRGADRGGIGTVLSVFFVASKNRWMIDFQPIGTDMVYATPVTNVQKAKLFPPKYKMYTYKSVKVTVEKIAE